MEPIVRPDQGGMAGSGHVLDFAVHALRLRRTLLVLRVLPLAIESP
jgi:hypothetical protein